MYKKLCTAPRIPNVGTGMETSGQFSALAPLILVPLHWRPSGPDSPTRRLSWLLFKEAKEYRRKRILFNAKKDTERKKEVTYECVGTLLSWARIILFSLHFLLEHSCHKWKGIKSSCRLCSKCHRVIPKCLRIEEDKTGNVRIKWHREAFLQTLLKWKINKYYISWVCICSLSYLACTAHAPYCHLWPTRLYNTVTHYPTNGTTFGKTLLNIKCVIWFFSTAFAWNISHSN